MSAEAKQLISEEIYLRTEASSETKHEFHQGRVFAMTGASLAHNQIAANLMRLLGNQLADTPCQPLGSDMRLKVKARGLYTYPDVMVVCGPIYHAGSGTATIVNPTLIIEILSKATEAYDRGDKFGHYRGIESLREYVLVSQTTRKVEMFSRQGSFWKFTDSQADQEQITFESINVTLGFEDIYARVAF